MNEKKYDMFGNEFEEGAFIIAAGGVLNAQLIIYSVYGLLNDQLLVNRIDGKFNARPDIYYGEAVVVNKPAMLKYMLQTTLKK